MTNQSSLVSKPEMSLPLMCVWIFLAAAGEEMMKHRPRMEFVHQTFFGLCYLGFSSLPLLNIHEHYMGMLTLPCPCFVLQRVSLRFVFPPGECSDAELSAIPCIFHTYVEVKERRCKSVQTEICWELWWKVQMWRSWLFDIHEPRQKGKNGEECYWR